MWSVYYQKSKKVSVDLFLYYYFNYFMEFRVEEEVDICVQLVYFDLIFYCDLIFRIYCFIFYIIYLIIIDYVMIFYIIMLCCFIFSGVLELIFMVCESLLLYIQEFCKFIVKLLVFCNQLWWEYLFQGIIKSYKFVFFFFLDSYFISIIL